MRRLVIGLGISLCAAFPRPAVGQTTLAMGDYVRVHTSGRSNEFVEGMFFWQDDSTIRVRAGGPTGPIVVLPTADITRLELDRKSGSEKVQGTAIGALAGGLLGAVVLITKRHEYSARRQAAVPLVLGLFTGQVIGSFIPRYSWTEAKLPDTGRKVAATRHPRIRPEAGWAGGKALVGLRLGF